MKWVILLVGLLALAAAVMAAVGAILPVKHTASRKARFRQPQNAVYAVIVGPPDWRPDVKAWARCRMRTAASGGGNRIRTARRSRLNWWKTRRHRAALHGSQMKSCLSAARGPSR